MNIIILYIVIYVLLSTASLIYLSKKRASRRIRIGVFLGTTAAFVVRVLQQTGAIPSFTELVEHLPLVGIYLLGMGISAAFFYHTTRSFRGFALYASAVGIIFFFPYIEGLTDTVRTILDFVWWVLIIGLLLGSGVVSYRDYLKWQASEDQ